MEIFDRYGRTQGQGQIAPGRDVSQPSGQWQPGPGRPPAQADINGAITGGMPLGGTTPFKGAQQTIGARPQEQPQPTQAIDNLFGGQGRTPGVADLPSAQNTGIAGGATIPGQAPAPTQPNPQWNTDGFAAPGYTAQTFGGPPPGWEAEKWNNPNHQTPKYVVGRILAEAGNLADPAAREAVLQKLQQAYPGTQSVNGKDKVSIPGVGVVDLYQAASAGAFRPQFIVEGAGGDSGGGAAQGAPGGIPSNIQQAIFGAPSNVLGENTQSHWESILAAIMNDPQLKQMTQGFK